MNHILELLNTIDFESILRLFLAFILSGIIGAQRELHNKPAGFKTHSLIGISAAVCVIANEHLSEFFKADAARIPAALVSGIGFVGAGTILTDGFNVKGLTTASSLLSVACIGIIIATGGYTIGIATTILIYILLSLSVKMFPNSLYHDHVEFSLKIVSSPDIMKKIERIFAKHSLLIDKITTTQVDEINQKDVTYICQYKTTLVFNKVISEVSSLENVISIEMNAERNLS